MGRPSALARELIACSGGLVELPAGEEGPLEALLPGELARWLGLEEHVRLSERPEPGTLALSYGSELLERMVELAGAAIPLGLALLPEQLPRGSDLGCSALEHFTGLNCALRPAREEARESWSGYLLLDYRCVCDADERRESLVRVAVNEESGADIALLQRIDDHPLLEPGLPGPLPLPGSADEVLSRAARAARRRARAELQPMVEAVRRRHQRDRQRLGRYFDALRTDMERQLTRSGRRRRDPDELLARRAKINALGPELERKLADLAERYRLRVRLEPVAALRLAVRTRRIELTVKRRQLEGRVAVHQSAATRTFDPLCCQACGESIHSFALCDERLHLLCAACDAARPSPRHCPICRAQADHQSRS